MAVQVRADNSLPAFAIGNSPKLREQEIILQEATRTVPLVPYTLMVKDTATQKWTPKTTANDATAGRNLRLGIYIGDSIAAATLVAGDTTGPILVGEALFDYSQLVFGTGPTGALGAETLTTVITPATGVQYTLQDLLEIYGLFAVNSLQVDVLEN